MATYEGYDFCGWATRNDVLCADGRTIKKGAFSHQNGQKVPLVWGHQHDSPEAVLGHGFLEDRPEGVYLYGYLNDSPMGKYSKIAIEHGDITSLSIWANQLKQNNGAVIHGDIKEVSLVLAGANKKACIDYPYIAHGDDTEEDVSEAYMYMGDEFTLAHSAPIDEPEENNIMNTEEAQPQSEEAEATLEHSDTEETMAQENKEDKTVGEVLDGLDPEQKKAVSVLIAEVMKQAEAKKAPKEKSKDDEDEDDSEDDTKDNLKHSDMEDNNMQYNAFDDMNGAPGYVLSHADEMTIISNARQVGSFKKAMSAFAEEQGLSHDDLAAASGFDSYPETAGQGVEKLFPEWHDVRPGAPELVTNDQDWVRAVLGQVHRSPFSRIRTSHVDIRGIDALRAKGYLKGKEKTLVGNYAVATRETAPQTVYVKSALNEDDIIDITDFDYVDYQYRIDKMELERELAQAVLVGDGRQDGSADKIKEDRIRNIWKDNDIFTIHKVLDVGGTPNGSNTAANFGEGYLYAQAMEETLLNAKIDYRGSGAMNMFCQQQFFNKMLLAKDLNGRRMYTNKTELAAALDVNNIYNVPEFEGLTRTVSVNGTDKTYRLLAIIGNLKDYSMGATKGGEIIHRTQFDIDFNQEKSLIETRVSGATTKLYSFIVIEEEVNP